MSPSVKAPSTSSVNGNMNCSVKLLSNGAQNVNCGTRTQSKQQQQQITQQAAGESVDESTQQIRPSSEVTLEGEQQFCDESSYFSREWVTSTVHTAVNHFFGDEFDEKRSGNGDSDVGDAINKHDNCVCDSIKRNNQNCRGGKSCDIEGSDQLDDAVKATIMPLSEKNSSKIMKDVVKNPLTLPLAPLKKVRSLSPSFSFHSHRSCHTSNIQGCHGLHCQETQCISHRPHDSKLKTQNTKGLSYQPYFALEDFSSQNWKKVLQDRNTVQAIGAGAVVLSAVIITHPITFIGAVAAAATARWAVGFFHELDKGYQLWSEEFGMLFWEDPPIQQQSSIEDGSVVGVAAIATCKSKEIIEQDKEQLKKQYMAEQSNLKNRLKSKVPSFTLSVKGVRMMEVKRAKDGDVVQLVEAKNGTERDRHKMEKKKNNMIGKKEQSNETQLKNVVPIDATAVTNDVNQSMRATNGYDRQEMRRTHSAPVKPTPIHLNNQPTKVTLSELLDRSTKQTSISDKENQQVDIDQMTMPSTITPVSESSESAEMLLARHFPKLDTCVVKEVELPGLHTAEFFRVFFADHAPYCMKDYQKKRGDVDVVYGSWGTVKNGTKCTFKDGNEDLLPVPSRSIQERTLNFSTLTKSYFGPAYAKATKVQRATQLSSQVLVIENITRLKDIPFSDRFCVLERWVVEAIKNDNMPGDIQDGMALYTSKLSIYGEVVMIKNCTWESQIRKKASETFKEVANEWCKTATAALEAAESRKRKRLNPLSRQSSISSPTSLTSPTSISSPKAQESELLAKHERNFQKLDNLISNGDLECLEWCSIEVMVSSSASTSAFAEVLETGYDNILVGCSLTDGTDTTEITDQTETTKETDSTDDFAINDDKSGKSVCQEDLSKRKRSFMRRISSRVSKSCGKTR